MKPVVTTAVPARPSLDARLPLALAAVYVIWGSTYLAMSVAIESMAPMWMACLRFTAAGIVMLALALSRGARVPPLHAWVRMAPVGVLLFLGGNGFIAIAEQSVSSGGAAVVCATMPLWVGVLGIVFGERPSMREWATLVVGFVGVVILMGGPSLAGKPEHIAAVICSPIAWALGSQLARRAKHVDGPHAALLGPAMQMLCGGFALAMVASLRGEAFPIAATGRSWLALGYLLGAGSLIGFTAYAWLLRNARAVVATSYAYVNPILAVLFGAALKHEPLGWSTLVANVLIVGAVMLALLRPRTK